MPVRGAIFLLLFVTSFVPPSPCFGEARPDAATAAGDVHRGVDRQLDVRIPRLEADVTIDGVLDEPVWERAAVLTGFSQYAPADGRPAEHQTDVLVWYSETAIHFGVRAHAEPGSVRASLANRDRIDADDGIDIFLSTFDDGRQANVFSVNPFGIQADGALVEGAGRQREAFGALTGGRDATDLSPDFVFTSKGRLTDYGYEVEVRIPFKSLRYQPQDRQDWGLNVIRRVQSSGHEDSWAPALRSGTTFLGQSGKLKELAGLRSGLVLDLNPFATAKADGTRRPSSWGYDTGAPEFGANIRWGVTPNLTLNGTVNPDFSQVEADAGQFVFDPRQAVFFPEKRPFFLEGIEQFNTPNRLVYTRRVVAPLAATKLTGKVSGTTVAVLSAVDDVATSASREHNPIFNIARLQRDIGNGSRAGMVYTDRIDGPDFNRVIGGDARFLFRKLYSLNVQMAGSFTERDGVQVKAPLYQAVLERNGKTFGFLYTLNAIDEDFRADSGFISRTGIARLAADHRVSLYGKPGALFETWTGDIVVDGTWQYERFVNGQSSQDRKLHLNNNFVLRGGWRTGGSVLIETFGFDDRLYADYALERQTADGVEYLPFTGTPRLANLDYVFTLNTPDFSTFSGSVFVIWGKDENFFEWSPADIMFGRYNVDWRPTDQLRVGAGYQIQSYHRRTDGTLVGRRRIPRLKVEYQLSRAIFLRWIGEYDANEQDTLRDDSRTDLPIVVLNRTTGLYERQPAFEENRFRNDWLFSYQPTPGTVLFAGYGSTVSEPRNLRFRELQRLTDGFFLKFSYLFRL
jgi:hypothetical protein